ncbi:nuclear prelamin A recognition factor isoform X2 [Talpa occidentalis]|uniref:nuclear prelamin A recognition factor isoform X2 n=1 Tax=Talpa occidentalis TaxID=50954 RepID=UPI00188F7066|nr:nuclear prelamin A recognition factor isoform X2 [Talpa occidentalis]
MKCERCTRKECSKKSKTADREDAPAAPPRPAREGAEKGEFHRLADVKVFLSDCLACDSCVTAEEGARVSQQNAEDFFRVLSLNKKCDTSKHKVLAVSVCPQSLPYFAAKFSLSVADASRRLCGFLKSLGVHYVFDTAIAADFSLLESQKEFVRRYRRHSEEAPALPMLTSACPGWVRYAERVLGQPVTPHLCTAKSPQQIMGSLVKDYFARRQNLSPDKIFHVIVAPCYDKKLEALEEDFSGALGGSRGADCVLTSGEIVQLMEQSDLSVEDAAVDTLNKDFQEVTLEKDGQVLLRFAAACGFRNVQNVVLKLKRGKFPYHFVEVLACPGGCLHGRGQGPAQGGRADKALLRQVDALYASVPVRAPEGSSRVRELYQEWLRGAESTRAQETLHTEFRGPGRPALSRDFKW